MSTSTERSFVPCGRSNCWRKVGEFTQLGPRLAPTHRNRSALMKKISDQQNRARNTGPSSPDRRTFVKGIAAMGAGVAVFPLLTNTAEAQVPAAPDNGIPSASSRAALQVPLAFQGDKIDWHGFDRYDFVMDKQTLAITPFKAPAGEQSGDLGNSDKGQLRCVVVVPKQAAPGNPWSWRGVYWNHQPQAEVE